MAMSDPLGDMLTRIRNAQTRRADDGGVPGVAVARQRARRAAAGRLHPWLFLVGAAQSASREFTIELKYHEGCARHSRHHAHLEAGPPRVFEDQGSAAVSRRPWHLDPVDAAGRHVGCRGSRRQCWRRSPLQVF